MMSMRQETLVYDMVGGEQTLRQLVEVFYAKIEADAELRAMFPEDLEPGKYWQFLFLMQYFGGPARYAAERGHPRLRMRHSPYPIDARARDRWLAYMLESIDEVGITGEAREIMRGYFERASAFMINLERPPDV